jgi:uncharacterized membrane protein YphA (DoxX/SURF4 family)
MQRRFAITVLRWGLAFVFFYAALSGVTNSEQWAGYIPRFVAGYFPLEGILSVFGIYEVILALWLFFGKKLPWAAMVAFITLSVIVILTVDRLDLTFPSIGLALAALALFDLSRRPKEEK